MATYSTDITVSWGETDFVEVRDLSFSYGGGPGKGRVTTVPIWTDEVGSVSVTCLGGANVTTAEYGRRDVLAISGGGISLTIWAVYESVSVQPQLNGVTQYTVTFKLLDG